jgi:hypothetical protein
MTDSLALARHKFLKQLGIMYSGSFVPHSSSRNRKKARLTEKCLNWKLNISRGIHKMKVDYSEGIAHCPSYRQGPMSAQLADDLDFEVENGRHAGQNKEIELPDLEDVLYSLVMDYCAVMDYCVLDYEKFEDWTAEYGYDFDSRTAEKIYEETKENALMLRIVLGDDNIKILRELFNDY